MSQADFSPFHALNAVQQCSCKCVIFKFTPKLFANISIFPRRMDEGCKTALNNHRALLQLYEQVNRWLLTDGFRFPFLCLYLSSYRLKVDNNGGAWCPKHMVSRNLNEYLQIDLQKMHVVTAIKTQGRFGKGQGREYTEAYVLEYWRPGFSKWKRWKNTRDNEVNVCPVLYFNCKALGNGEK